MSTPIISASRDSYSQRLPFVPWYQSFEIDGDTPNYLAKSLAPAAYAVASYVRKNTHLKKDKSFTVACRTLEGTCKEPTVVGCWRIS